jgi:hypothetical protein
MLSLKSVPGDLTVNQACRRRETMSKDILLLFRFVSCSIDKAVSAMTSRTSMCHNLPNGLSQ